MAISEVLALAQIFLLLACAALINTLARACSRLSDAYDSYCRRELVRLVRDEEGFPPASDVQDSPYAHSALTDEEAYELEKAENGTRGTDSRNTSASWSEADDRMWAEEMAAIEERRRR